jgi:hypothetical protein
MDAHEELYSNRDYCMKELGASRTVMTSKGFTKAKYEQVTKALALMYLYCPKDIQDFVEAIMNEAHIRVLYCTE